MKTIFHVDNKFTALSFYLSMLYVFHEGYVEYFRKND